MHAVRFHTKRDIRVEEMPAPDQNLKPHETLIAPLLCGICGTDLHEFIAGPIVTPVEPNKLTGAVLPQILGHEFSATVLRVGSAVTHVAPGDRVSIQPLMAPEDDFYAKRGLLHLSETLGVIGLSHAWGGMGEQAVVDGRNVIPIPATLTDAQGALVEPAAVAVYAIDRSRLKAGGSVLISGAGPIGALAVLAAKVAGASTIIVSERNPERLAKAAALVPGIIAVNPDREDVAEVARRCSEGGAGVDAALECVGAEASLNACARAVRRQGVVVQVGLHTKPASVDPMLWALKDISLEATWCYPVQIWPRIVSMIESGGFPVEKIVTAEIPMHDVVEKGFEELLDPSGRHLKILVRVNQAAAAS
jgi:(R,R)-butanediol dehydrogenase/meso-butanediol dehydrogenase/diacetyl reductase